MKNKDNLEFYEKGSVEDVRDHMETEMIYANGNVIKRSEMESISSKVKNISVPLGRKPALPPKPPNRLQLTNMKPKGFVHNACVAIFDRKSPQSKKDPAEMSLKERLALFEEKNKSTMPNEEYCGNGGDGQILTPLISRIGTCFVIIFSLNLLIFLYEYIVSSSITISTRAYEDGSNGKSESTMYEITSGFCRKPEDLRNCSKKTEHLANAIASKRAASPRSRPPPPPSKSSLIKNMEVLKPPEEEYKEESQVDVICQLNNGRKGKCDLIFFKKRLFPILHSYNSLHSSFKVISKTENEISHRYIFCMGIAQTYVGGDSEKSDFSYIRLYS